MNRYTNIFLSVLCLVSFIAQAQVVVTKNIDYRSDATYEKDKDLLDVYMPKHGKNVPVIVYFHGGALVMGDKSYGEVVGQKVAETGIGLVSVNYRLSPEFAHPAHVKDAAAATAWVFKNIAHYGGDPKNIFVGGHSAGAYLAALVAIDSSHLAVHGSTNRPLSGAVLISPFLYVEETAKERIARDSIYTSIWGMDPQNWKKASVTPHILPNRDNILLIYADGDDAWRKEQNERFAAAMTKVGNRRVFTSEVPNRTHMTIISAIPEEDDRVIDLIRAFIFKK